MYVPQLPTDNLYKFIALTGIVTIGFSVTYPVGKAIELESKQIIASAQMERLQIQVEAAKRLAVQVEHQQHPSGEGMKLLGAMSERNQLSLVDIKMAVAQSNQQAAWLRIYIAASITGVGTGILLAGFGFRLWYIRVQRPSDTRLQREVAEGSKE